eukprot:g46731.t1
MPQDVDVSKMVVWKSKWRAGVARDPALILMKDFVKLERVQKRFTRMLPVLEVLSYRETLNRLEIFCLEHRRLRSDIKEVYKIMMGMDR